jgi:phospholipid transport system substrate-binding protein
MLNVVSASRKLQAQFKSATRALACVAAVCWAVTGTSFAAAAVEAPNALIARTANEIIGLVKADPQLASGDVTRLQAVVDELVMPHVDFARMTASAVGRAWRSATPAQKERLQTEFKTLLVRTYAGAVKQMKDRRIEVKPMRIVEGDTQTTVRSRVVGGQGEPIPLDYRMVLSDTGWKIVDINVLGLWLIETYRTQFAVVSGGDDVDALILALAQLNNAQGN